MTAPTNKLDVGAMMTDEQIRKSMTSEQIQLERKLTCEAIDGAMAFGYQNTNQPPSDDHWLAPFWKIGRKQAELELLSASKPAVPMGCVLVEEADFVPYVHPQYGSGVFCTEDCLNKLAAFPTDAATVVAEVVRWNDPHIEPCAVRFINGWDKKIPHGAKLYIASPTAPAQPCGDAEQADEAMTDAFARLVAFHAEQLDSNPYCYFELAYTRSTAWMAWITDRPAQGEPGTAAHAKSRKVIVRGQGDTPTEACQDALNALNAARKDSK